MRPCLKYTCFAIDTHVHLAPVFAVYSVGTLAIAAGSVWRPVFADVKMLQVLLQNLY